MSGLIAHGDATAGPGHNEQVAAICGEPIQYGTPVVATCVYLTPTWTAYQLAGGRIAVLVDRTCGHHVYVFADYGAFRDWDKALFAGYDPETGRWR